MIYCLDTSALISLGERYYPEHVSVFKPIWNHIYKSIEDGGIISVDYVKKELEEKADGWRKNFITKADNMFHISESIEVEFASLILEIERGQQFLDNMHRKRFMKEEKRR